MPRIDDCGDHRSCHGCWQTPKAMQPEILQDRNKEWRYMLLFLQMPWCWGGGQRRGGDDELDKVQYLTAPFESVSIGKIFLPIFSLFFAQKCTVCRPSRQPRPKAERSIFIFLPTKKRGKALYHVPPAERRGWRATQIHDHGGARNQEAPLRR